jgi:hypothetical protein
MTSNDINDRILFNFIISLLLYTHVYNRIINLKLKDATTSLTTITPPKLRKTCHQNQRRKLHGT